jgi:hypothetical protein
MKWNKVSRNIIITKDTKEFQLKKIKMDIDILMQYSELLYTRKPKQTRQISKKKIIQQKENEAKELSFEKEIQNQEEMDDIESQGISILNEDDDERAEIEELMDFLKNKSKERMQKAKIFYKNLKFNFELLDKYYSDEESEEDQEEEVRKKKIKRVKNRVINEVIDKFHQDNMK